MALRGCHAISFWMFCSNDALKKVYRFTESEISNIDNYRDADLVLGSDGVNSTVKRLTMNIFSQRLI